MQYRDMKVTEGPPVYRHILRDKEPSQAESLAARWVVGICAVIGAITLAVGIFLGAAKALGWLWGEGN